MLKALLAVLVLTGCHTMQQKNQALYADRVAKLKPLGRWTSRECAVEVALTQPARSRFEEMFPKETVPEKLEYVWYARERSCEIRPRETSPVSVAEKSFLDASICLLMQTHLVNSPFDEFVPKSIEGDDKFVRLAAGDNPDLGIFLARDTFTVETRTKSRGTLVATYGELGGQWVPFRLEHQSSAGVVAVEDVQYDGGLKSFWVSAGTDKILKHAEVTVGDCR